jgi:hypothetical protein
MRRRLREPPLIILKFEEQVLVRRPWQARTGPAQDRKRLAAGSRDYVPGAHLYPWESVPIP